MLSEKAKNDILEISSHYELKRAACIEALQVAQQEHGWISKDTLRDVAAVLEMTPEEVDNVAAFYSLIFRAPVGRHVIMLCDSISCSIMGYASIAGYLKRQFGIGFGETSADGRFTLIPIACLGNCDRAPTLIIDRDTYGNVGPDNIGSILEKYQ